MKVAGTPRVVGELLLEAMPQLTERLAEERLRRAWTAVVGPDVARRTRPGQFLGGSLDVIVDNSPWLHELTLRQAELLARVREHVPGVQAVRLVAGGQQPGRPEPAPRAPRRRALREAERREIDQAVEGVSDAEVAGAARRLLTRAYQAAPEARS